MFFFVVCIVLGLIYITVVYSNKKQVLDTLKIIYHYQLVWTFNGSITICYADFGFQRF